MAITVRLFAALREHVGHSSLELELAPNETVGSLFDRLFVDSAVQGLRPSLLFAVNRDYVSPDHELRDGDEVAFIPPLGGGAPAPEGEPIARVFLSREPLNLSALIDCVRGPGRGGITTFTGTVRDHFEGRPVLHLDYEAYEEMVLPKMAELCEVIEARWPETSVAMAHRVGRLHIGDEAVHVAVGAPHRDAAFAACRFAIDELKATVPIFKKEIYEDGSQWKAQGGG